MNDTKKRLLLVDASSYLYRAFHAMPEFRSPAGEPTGAILGVVNMLRKLEAGLSLGLYRRGLRSQGQDLPRRDLSRVQGHAPGDARGPRRADRAALRDDPRARLAARRGRRRRGRRRDRHARAPRRARARLGHAHLHGRQGPHAARERAHHLDEHHVQRDARPEGRGGQVRRAAGADRRLPRAHGRRRGQRAGRGQGGPQDGGEAHPAVRLARGRDGARRRGEGRGGREPAQGARLAAHRAHARHREDGRARCPSRSSRWCKASRTRRSSPRSTSASASAACARRCDKGERRAAPHPRPLSPQSRASRRSAVSSAAPSAERESGPASDVHAFVDTRHYETVLDEAALERWLARIEAAELTCFDTETTSLDPMAAQLVGLSFCVQAGEAAYIPLAHRYPGAPDQLDLEAHAREAQALVRDARAIARSARTPSTTATCSPTTASTCAASCTTRCSPPTCWKATSATTWIRSPCATSARRRSHYEEVAGKGASSDLLRPGERRARDRVLGRGRRRHLPAARRALAARRGGREAAPHLRRHRDPRVGRAPRHGAQRRAHRLARCSPRRAASWARRCWSSKRKAHELAGQPFNLASPKQLGEILFERLKLPVVKKTPSGAPSTDEEVLEKLALDHPLPKALLEHRGDVEAQEHLHRQAAAHGERAHRPRAHQLRAGRGGDGAPVLHRSQPAEHPRAHRRGPAHPRGLHRAARLEDRLGRLLADRAAHHGAPVGRQEPHRRLRGRRGHPPPHGVARCSAWPPAKSRASSAATPR